MTKRKSERLLPYTTMSVTAGEKDVIQERQRQITEEHWTPDLDDKWTERDLAAAAATYAYGATYDDYTRSFQLSPHRWGRSRLGEMWPSGWDTENYKPTTARRDLVKAAALILAEIERIDRKAERDRSKALDEVVGNASLEAEYGTR